MSLPSRLFNMNRRLGNGLGFLACAGLMGYALFAQHVLGLEPCPLCIFQRVATVTLGVIFLIAALHNPGRTGARVYAVLLGLTALCGIAICARHIWILAQPPGTVAACGASLDFMLDVLPMWDVITKVLTGSGECGVLNWTFLGLSMPAWVAICLTLLGAWGVAINSGLRTADRFVASKNEGNGQWALGNGE